VRYANPTDNPAHTRSRDSILLHPYSMVMLGIGGKLRRVHVNASTNSPATSKGG
jgi:hypothetical protein